ncbi:MAG: tRNA 2-selenouridine(34) synthase MnmH [Sediminibacterium sp.]|nr:tRNA 2-selenouridine(34) synthase MnmH [Sediminibacterium sp.]
MKGEGLDANTFISLSQNRLLIDVRSPVEYKKGHIPGAVNIPLFENDERAEIGTLYKLKGRQIAIDRGYELVAPKLDYWVKQVREMSQEQAVFVYCFRGGMRSNSFTWLLNQNGIDAKLLTGGYKSYRQTVIRLFETPQRFVLLGGATGSRKTDILRYISENNLLPVIDLEQLAHHKGSAFGTIGEREQLPQQIFENMLYNCLQLQKNVFLMEDEAMSIGYNKIPYPLWLQMKKAPIIKLVIPFELRVKKIMSDYGNASVDELKTCLLRIGDQLGGQLTKECIEELDNGRINSVARTILNYYDKAYAFQHEKKKDNTFIIVESGTDNLEENAERIVKVFKELCRT